MADAWTSLLLAPRRMRGKEWKTAGAYALYFLFSVIALAIGPLAAFMISKEIIFGFGGHLSGPCLHQWNFTTGATNIPMAEVSVGLDHHGLAIELLPRLSTFTYSWSNRSKDEYLSGASIINPVSKANYTRVPGCALRDDVLCDGGFPHTRTVSGDLTAPQLGMWSGNHWKFSMESSCIRLNSSAISYQAATHGWLYHLSYAKDSFNTSEIYRENTLGQRETERYARRKNFITDTYFLNESAQVGWGHEMWRQSLRDLDVNQVAVITILPSTENINQDETDDIYAKPVPASEFDFHPSQMVHLLCWEKLFVSLKKSKTKVSIDWNNRTEFVLQNDLPLGVEPLMQMSDGEFILKPLRFLRGNTLLQYTSDTPRREYDATLAPIVPFGAEMHRWAHIGLMDIASKATRTTTGYYARGVPQDTSSIAALQNSHLHDLCRSVRAVK